MIAVFCVVLNVFIFFYVPYQFFFLTLLLFYSVLTLHSFFPYLSFILSPYRLYLVHDTHCCFCVAILTVVSCRTLQGRRRLINPFYDSLTTLVIYIMIFSLLISLPISCFKGSYISYKTQYIRVIPCIPLTSL